MEFTLIQQNRGSEWYLINRQFSHNLFNERNRFLIVFSEKQSNKETPVVKFQQFLSYHKKNTGSSGIQHFDHDILAGAKDMKIPRIRSLPASLPTSGKKMKRRNSGV